METQTVTVLTSIIDGLLLKALSEKRNYPDVGSELLSKILNDCVSAACLGHRNICVNMWDNKFEFDVIVPEFKKRHLLVSEPYSFCVCGLTGEKCSSKCAEKKWVDIKW